MHSEQKRGEVARSLALYALCALLPAAILAFCLALAGEYPFGDTRLLGEDYDVAYQYANLLAWLQNVLLGNADLLYSQGKSLGGNMFATYSYYVASPLNLLLVFFPQGDIEDFYFFVRLLRTALCGITIAVFVRRRLSNVSQPLVLALAICYALSQYNIVQATNVMWLDAPILMPLVALGVYRFVTEGRMKLIIVALAVSIWSCWYTGYMMVVASLFVFVLEYWLQANNAGGKFPWRAFVRKLVKFGLVLLLVAAATMVVLAPSVYGLLSGKGSSLEATSKPLRCYPWDFFTAVLPLNFRFNWQRPQLFCGTITLAAAILLLFARKVAKRDKVAFVAILLMLMLCMFVSAFDRVWTGFTDGNNYYCRWGFAPEFFLVFAAAYALNSGLPTRKEALKVLLCLIAVGVIGLALGGFNPYGLENAQNAIDAGRVQSEFVLGCFSFFSKPVCFAFFVAVCLALFAVWALARRANGQSGKADDGVEGLPSFKQEPKRRFVGRIMAVALVLLVSVDMGVNALSVVLIDEVVCHDLYGGNYTQYNKAASQSLSKLRETDPGLWRADKTYSHLQDHSRLRVPTCDGLALGYMPLSCYLSTSDTSVLQFMGDMGYAPRQSDADGMIEGTYPTAILPSDSLLGLRYVATGDTVYGYQNTGLESGDRTGNADAGTHYWYKNNNAFPLAFGVGAGATASIGEQSDAFTYQNKLFQALFGTSEQMYTTLDSTKVSSDDSGICWTVDQSSSNDLCYVEVRSTQNYQKCFWSGFSLSLDGEAVAGGYYRAFSYGIVPAGSITAGEEIALGGSDGIGLDESMTLYVVQANKDLLDSFTQQANAKAATFNEFRDGRISASYTASAEDAYLFMSIPYDAGWTVKVNGRVVQPELVGGCLMAIPVTEGENSIELSYCSPMLVQGAAVSGLAWTGIIVFVAVRAARRKRVGK